MLPACERFARSANRAALSPDRSPTQQSVDRATSDRSRRSSQPGKKLKRLEVAGPRLPNIMNINSSFSKLQKMQCKHHCLKPTLPPHKSNIHSYVLPEGRLQLCKNSCIIRCINWYVMMMMVRCCIVSVLLLYSVWLMCYKLTVACTWTSVAWFKIKD